MLSNKYLKSPRKKKKNSSKDRIKYPDTKTFSILFGLQLDLIAVASTNIEAEFVF